MGRFRYGTSSWSEKSWEGAFYPAGTAAGDYLRHYATQFDTVEADSTYYRIPPARMVDGWVEKTPPGFLLSAKFPGSITHGGKEQKPDPERVLVPEVVGDELEQFLTVMRRLGDRRGPLVLQFPYFNRQVFPGPGPFFERLDAFLGLLPDDFRYAVELRNKSWLKPPLLEILRRHRAALVLVDLVYMPHPDEYGFDPVTTEFSYVRLIGDRKAVEEKTDRFDRIVVDHGPRLRRWADVIRRMMQHVPEVFAYANNHFAGHGPATIRELAGLVGAESG